MKCVYQGEAGYWTSADECYFICPHYEGTTRPQSYALQFADKKRHEVGGFMSVRQAKDHAAAIAMKVTP